MADKKSAVNGVVTIEEELESIVTVGRQLEVPVASESEETVFGKIAYIVQITDDKRTLAIVSCDDDQNGPMCMQFNADGKATKVSIAEAITVMPKPISEVLAVNAEVVIPMNPPTGNGPLSVEGKVIFISNGENGMIDVGEFGVGSYGRRFTNCGNNTVISIGPPRKTAEKEEKK